MMQTFAFGQCFAGSGHIGGHIGRGDGNAGLGVRDVVLQLFGAVHGVDGHHHRIGPQDAKVRRHQLGAVLHVQQDAVAFLNAFVVQPSSDALGLVGELLVAEGATQKLQRGFVGETLCAEG